MIDITCKDCGAAHQVRRSNAKYCPPCRLIRNVTFAAKKFKRVRACRACTESYRPVHAQDYDLCGSCTQPTLANQGLAHEDYGECGVCGETKTLLEGTKVCMECLKDPDQQKRILTRMRTAQKDRIKENAS